MNFLRRRTGTPAPTSVASGIAQQRHDEGDRNDQAALAAAMRITSDVDHALRGLQLGRRAADRTVRVGRRQFTVVSASSFVVVHGYDTGGGRVLDELARHYRAFGYTAYRGGSRRDRQEQVSIEPPDLAVR